MTWKVVAAAIASCGLLSAADWPTQGGSPQREGWARTEKVFSKESAGDLDLLYRYQADNQSRGLYSLTSPIVDGLLITFRGFKEMLVFGGSADSVFSVDADLGSIIWTRNFDYEAKGKEQKKSTLTCPGGLTAAIAMAGSASAVVSFRHRPEPKPGKSAPIGGAGFGSIGAFFAVSSDGYVHALNASTGEDLVKAVPLTPPNSRVSALNVVDNIVYAATSGNCSSVKNAVYAVDLGSEDKKVYSMNIDGKAISGSPGTAVGNDGTVYVEAPAEQGEEENNSHQTIMALDALTLGVKDFFVAGDAANGSKHIEGSATTPTIISWQGKDLVVASGRDGRMYLLDSTSMGGPDHHKPLFASEPIAQLDTDYSGNGFHGGFASWTDSSTGTRWVYAALWGAPQGKFPIQNGNAAKGSIVAFKLEDKNGTPVLTPAWISPAITSPATPVISGGLVFALATGESAREATEKGKPLTAKEIEKGSTHAVLYALDAETGKQLYSSGGKIPSPAPGSTLAIANGRIYFGTSDNRMNAFGFLKMQPQLTEK